MRIIGGRNRGHPLVAPRGTGTRPTTDMVREALFSALFDVEGFVVLDLFAGTGAVGLEALSRGAQHVTFVEKSRAALAALDKNLDALRIDRAAVVVQTADVLRALPRLLAAPRRFDLIYADPPYDKAGLVLPELLAVGQALLAEDGVIVCEHRSSDPAPEAPEGLACAKTRRYGEAALAFYEAPEA